MDNTTTDNTRLQEFVTNAAFRRRITFGDVRRLQRDYLPCGVSTCEEAELLIHLDGKVGRADRAWADWLVTVILEFATQNEPPIDGFEADVRERLKAALESAYPSTKATRKIAREIRRDVRHGWPQADKESVLVQADEETTLAQAANWDGVACAMEGLQLAA